MSDKFIHLHNHSTYSPLDGMIRPEELIAKVKQLGQRGVAISDHGNMSAAPQLYMEAKKQDIIPFIGQEFYIVPDASDRTKRSNHHIIFIALNERGYRSLVELTTVANSKENYYYNPRIDHRILNHYRKDFRNIAVLTACMSGELQSAFDSEEQDWKNVLSFYRKMFPNLYLELQHHTISSLDTDDPDDWKFDALQQRNFQRLLTISKRYQLPYIVTNDAHYLEEDDWEAHDVMLAMQTKSLINQKKRFRFSGQDYYISTGREMRAKVGKEIYTNSLMAIQEIVNNTNITIPEFDTRVFHIPTYKKNAIGLVKDLCELALKKYGKEYWDRYNYEIAIIEKANFADEILIVKDYVEWARNEGIECGAGRGSMVGVLVSFLLNITTIDPIKYNLSFERAINPDRPSLPDFDVDFEDDRRQEVFDYLRSRWGDDNVVQVGTFSTLAARGIIGSIMRAAGYTAEQRFAVTRTVAQVVEVDDIRRKTTIEDILEDASEELKGVLTANPWIGKIAAKLQGIVSGHGKHAAGVIISDKRKPIASHVPKMLVASSGSVVSQYNMYDLGKMGLIKFDVLGLSTLSVIAECRRFIGASNPFEGVDITSDGDTLLLLNRGDVLTIFELQGAASQKAVRAVGVRDFNDVIALQALSRAGGNQFIPDYKEGRDGSQAWKKRFGRIHPALLDILASTYGVVLYQEQIMDMARKVAGLDWTMVDRFKDAIKHKSGREMEGLRQPFYEGCHLQGLGEKSTDTVWKLMERASGYLFNLSHATAYAMICQQTAYLKAHYPRQWFAAYLNHCAFDERGAIYENMRQQGLRIYQPDITKPSVNAVPTLHGVRLGLQQVKGIGTASAQTIIKNPIGSFEDLAEFKINKNVMRVLEQSGALRNIGIPGTEDMSVQMKLFGGFVSIHPLDIYKDFLNEIYKDDNLSILQGEEDGNALLGGMIVKAREIQTKKGDDMGFVDVSFYGTIYSAAIFPDMWDKAKFKPGKVIILRGNWQPSRKSLATYDYGSLRVNKKTQEVEWVED
jgi:DNA polymerase-3 subunit alpha